MTTEELEELEEEAIKYIFPFFRNSLST